MDVPLLDRARTHAARFRVEKPLGPSGSGGFSLSAAMALASSCFDALNLPGHTSRMQADVSFSPSPALWVILAVVVLGTLAGWFWVRRSRAARGPSARPAVFSLLGDVTENALPTGWSDEQIVVVVGDVRMDLRSRPPTDGSILRVFHLIGDVRLRVSPGTRVITSGSTLLGDQRISVEPGEGPEFEVRGWGLIGDVEISDRKRSCSICPVRAHDAAGARRRDGLAFPCGGEVPQDPRGRSKAGWSVDKWHGGSEAIRSWPSGEERTTSAPPKEAQGVVGRGRNGQPRGVPSQGEVEGKFVQSSSPKPGQVAPRLPSECCP